MVFSYVSDQVFSRLLVAVADSFSGRVSSRVCPIRRSRCILSPRCQVLISSVKSPLQTLTLTRMGRIKCSSSEFPAQPTHCPNPSLQERHADLLSFWDAVGKPLKVNEETGVTNVEPSGRIGQVILPPKELSSKPEFNLAL